MNELRQKLEALLFSSGRSMNIEELSRLCRSSEEDIEKALKEIQYDYNEKNSSIMVVNEGKSWKLTTKEKYLELVKKIVTQTELTKSVMETLAVIAFMYPIKQSDLIKIRSNKAYDHLGQLEELGYISRQKHGRTKLIKLTQKFFDYFDLPPEKLKEKFHDFESIAKAIGQKEEEIERIKEEQKQKAEEEKQKQEEKKEKIEKEIEQIDKDLDETKIEKPEQKEVDLIDSEGHKVKLEVVDEKPEIIEEEPSIEVEKEKLGSLDVVDEPLVENEGEPQDNEETDNGEEGDLIKTGDEEQEEYTEGAEEKKHEDQQNTEKGKDFSDENSENGYNEKNGIKTTPEMEVKIEKRVEEMTHPETNKEAEPEQREENNNKEEISEEEKPKDKPKEESASEESTEEETTEEKEESNKETY